MSSSEPNYREFIRRLAKDLLREMNQQRYVRHKAQIRSLHSLSEKLVYEHLLYNQPLGFTVLRRDLEIDKRTLSRALRRLMARGWVVQNEHFQYVLPEP